jgi:hypothetical protein
MTKPKKSLAIISGAIIVLAAIAVGEYFYFQHLTREQDESSQTTEKPLVDAVTLPVKDSSPECTHRADCEDFVKYRSLNPSTNEFFIAIYGRVISYTPEDGILLELKDTRVKVQLSDLQYCNYLQINAQGGYPLERKPTEECPSLLKPGQRIIGECLDESCAVIHNALLINVDTIPTEEPV